MQITVCDTRTLAQKKALYRRIVELLTESPGLRPDDIFINLLQVPSENGSVGLGEAQVAPADVRGEKETSAQDEPDLANRKNRN